MKSPYIMRHYQVVEINGGRETIISRHATRFEANRAKKQMERTTAGKLIVRARWA